MSSLVATLAFFSCFSSIHGLLVGTRPVVFTVYWLVQGQKYSWFTGWYKASTIHGLLIGTRPVPFMVTGWYKASSIHGLLVGTRPVVFMVYWLVQSQKYSRFTGGYKVSTIHGLLVGTRSVTSNKSVVSRKKCHNSPVPYPNFPSRTPAFPAMSSINFPTVIREGKP